MPDKRPVKLLLCISLVFITISGAGVQGAQATSNALGNGAITHVIIVVLENEPYSPVVGNSAQAPYENLLAGLFPVAANYYSVEHPSLPNYIDLTGGSDMGITSDCAPSSSCDVAGSNAGIAKLLDSKGLSWKEYAESMPGPCYLNNSGDYAVRHNPFVYYTYVTSNASYCKQHVVPFEDPTAGFFSDLGRGNLPSFSFITPNICHDGHDLCPGFSSNVEEADEWLSGFVPRVITSHQFNSTALFVTYDEGDASTKISQVFTVLVSQSARIGFASTVRYTHFSLLATTENILGLGSLGRNDTNAPVMNDLFSTPVVGGSSQNATASLSQKLNDTEAALKSLTSEVGPLQSNVSSLQSQLLQSEDSFHEYQALAYGMIVLIAVVTLVVAIRVRRQRKQ